MEVKRYQFWIEEDDYAKGHFFVKDSDHLSAIAALSQPTSLLDLAKVVVETQSGNTMTIQDAAKVVGESEATLSETVAVEVVPSPEELRYEFFNSQEWFKATDLDGFERIHALIQSRLSKGGRV